MRAAPIAAASLLLAMPVAAPGGQDGSDGATLGAAPWVTDGFRAPGGSTFTERSAFRSGGTTARTGQHGETAHHLPAVRENMEVVGKLEMDTPDQYKLDPTTLANDPTEPEVVAGQIADVAVYKDAAYLMSWDEPTCERGGFFSVDISNPSAPRQVAFVPALEDTYHGEGAHAITMNVGGVARDILAVNNEPCSADGFTGFDLYDVTDPARPQTLVQGVGDQTEDGSTNQDPEVFPSSYHSVFMWSANGRSFLVGSDNPPEAGTTDVDIFDITNPAAPVFIADIDIKELAEQQGVDVIDNSANGETIFNHDMIVKEIGGVQTMLVSYWDAGYVKLNVNDPRNPRIIGDSRFDDTDPLTGFTPPEGNGHQAEFSHDNRFVLGADEDFTTYRTDFEITTGPNAGPYPSGEFGFTRPIATLPDKRLNGPTVFGGRGCTTEATDPAIPPADSEIPPSSLEEGEEQIVVISRGLCRFDEKIQNAQNAGYEGAIIGNSHSASDGGEFADAAFCGGGNPRDIRAMCIGHRAMHLLFGDEPSYTGADGTDIPHGANGEKVSSTAMFDGWGYTQLYRQTADGNLERVDSFAIEEALDERYAFGFGDLSVHEHATDPAVNLSYVAYYSGGMRVLRFGDGGFQQVGKFIDEGGSNFWGVEQFTADNGERLIAGSDRDFGLYLFRYTGPDAVGPRPPAPAGPSRGRCVNVLAATASSVAQPFRGTAGGDRIAGTAARDVIDAQAGDDCVDGMRGHDRLRGGSGIDTLDGQHGNDRLRGGSGRGNLRGGQHHDRLWGGSAKDVLFGNTGRDRLSGGRGTDQLFGGSGRDRLIGGRGKDVIEAGTGHDRIFARDGRRDKIDCGFGRDRVVADRRDRVASCERVSRG